MVLSGFLMIHDTLVGGEDNESKLSGWKDLINKLLEILKFEIESWGDNTTFVESSVKINDDLSVSSIIDDLEFTDVTVLLHASEELDDNLGDWSEHNLLTKGVRNQIKISNINNIDSHLN